MSNDTTIGSLIESSADRDAIHIAVAPVQAGEDLAPGSHVGFLPHSHAAHVVGICDRTIGIVDPFLKEWVREGQWFYMCLYPRTITSLRHNWSHPDFPCVAPSALSPEPNSRLEMSASEQYIRNFAASVGYNYTETLSILKKAINDGSPHVGDDYMKDKWDAHKVDLLAAAAVVLGHKEPVDPEEIYFGCAC